jgi:hypothetical protein
MDEAKAKMLRSWVAVVLSFSALQTVHYRIDRMEYPRHRLDWFGSGQAQQG